MAKNIKPDKLGEAIAEQLTIYGDEVTEKIDEAALAAAKKLVKLTKATAPVGARGSFKRNIKYTKVKETKRGTLYAWHVKPPDHRLTHLLVHGHATRDGGRTKADPFLQNALDVVLPEYEKAVKEAIEK